MEPINEDAAIAQSSLTIESLAPDTLLLRLTGNWCMQAHLRSRDDAEWSFKPSP